MRTLVIILLLGILLWPNGSFAQDKWSIEATGAIGTVSTEVPTGIVVNPGDPIGSSYLYAVANLTNSHELDANASAVVRVTSGNGAYLGGCLFPHLNVIASQTQRFVCP